MNVDFKIVDSLPFRCDFYFSSILVVERVTEWENIGQTQAHKISRTKYNLYLFYDGCVAKLCSKGSYVFSKSKQSIKCAFLIMKWSFGQSNSQYTLVVLCCYQYHRHCHKHQKKIQHNLLCSTKFISCFIRFLLNFIIMLPIGFLKSWAMTQSICNWFW